MEGARLDVLVLRDGEGAYYLLPWEVVERARVPAELTAEIDRIVTGDDLAGFGAARESTAGASDSISDLSEMSSLRMQLAMDRHTKLLTMVSNVMGTVATTHNSVVQNLK